MARQRLAPTAERLAFQFMKVIKQVLSLSLGDPFTESRNGLIA